ncbi:MAG: 30S ribosomal protein S6 [Clostridiaceae bacterium]|nr:30S ribosomal protein S6 [Clostridiaceae bacterium]
MAKKYELLYVLNGTLSSDELRAQINRVSAIVEASAEIVQVTEWGRRRLAYEIQDLREGYYVIVHFNAEPDAPREIERLLRIADYVLRYLIVVAEGSFMPVARRLAEEEEELEEEKETTPDELPDETVAEETVTEEGEPEQTVPEEEGAAGLPEPESLEETQSEGVDEMPEDPERNEE